MVTGAMESARRQPLPQRCEFFHPTVLVRCSKLQVTDTLEVRLVKGTRLALPVESGHGGQSRVGKFSIRDVLQSAEPAVNEVPDVRGFTSAAGAILRRRPSSVFA